jgi:pilus assembly protein CpaE
MAQLSFVIVSSRAEIGAALEQSGHALVKERLSRAGSLAEAVRRHRPDALFVDLVEDADARLDEVEALPGPRPLLLATGPEEESQLILRAMRLGAREYFPPELGNEHAFRAAVERLILEHQPANAADVPKAAVIAVMGAKGGVGATFLSCQLAAALQRIGGRTAIVDLNLRVGDVALYFDLHPRYTISSLASDRQEIDAASLETVLEPHQTGVHLLAAPARAEEADLVGVAQVERAVSLLRSEFDWVILDVSRSWDEISVRALDLADQIFLVTVLDVPNLNHTRQHMDLLQRLGHPLEKIRLIANRYTKSAPVTAKDVVEFLGRGADLRIPNDYANTLACVNEGRPVWEAAPKSELCAAYARLAASAYGWCKVARPDTEARSGLTRRLRSYFRRS